MLNPPCTTARKELFFSFPLGRRHKKSSRRTFRSEDGIKKAQGELSAEKDEARRTPQRTEAENSPNGATFPSAGRSPALTGEPQDNSPVRATLYKT